MPSVVPVVEILFNGLVDGNISAPSSIIENETSFNLTSGMADMSIDGNEVLVSLDEDTYQGTKFYHR